MPDVPGTPAGPGPGPDGESPYRDVIRAAAQIARQDGGRPWVIVLTLIFGAENVTATPSGIVVSKTPQAGAPAPADTTTPGDA